ncbi:S-adenosyl-L-methionine-dependent methyltransferase, partial [Conidiobolus coronatus NRRL 28638]
PTYEKPLFESVIAYHKRNGGEFGTALDLGTGTGQVASELVDYFDKVIGVDHSEVMIKTAIQHPKIEYKVGDCLNIPVPDASLDLLVIGEAIHYFPIPEFWAEVKRIVKPGGTLGFWGYTNNICVEYPVITDLIWEFTMETLGPYWDKGKENMDELLQSHVDNLPFENVEGRVFFAHPKIEYNSKVQSFTQNNQNFVTSSIPDSGFVKPIQSLGQLSNYLKTWHGYHKYLKNNPNSENPVDAFIKKAMDKTGLGLDSKVELEFPQIIVLSKVE